jgi:hypothetical protein
VVQTVEYLPEFNSQYCPKEKEKASQYHTASKKEVGI